MGSLPLLQAGQLIAAQVQLSYLDRCGLITGTCGKTLVKEHNYNKKLLYTMVRTTQIIGWPYSKSIILYIKSFLYFVLPEMKKWLLFVFPSHKIIVLILNPVERFGWELRAQLGPPVQ
jgi:hypothetical protein